MRMAKQKYEQKSAETYIVKPHI